MNNVPKFNIQQVDKSDLPKKVTIPKEFQFA